MPPDVHNALFPAPDADAQRALTLECAAARTLHRVALLRARPMPQALRELDVLRAEPLPVGVDRLVPLAHELCKKDPDGRATDAAVAWLAERAQDHHELRDALDQARRSRRRWHAARTAVVRANLRLGSSIVHRHYMRSGIPYDDLFQESVLGLIKAADRFDPNYGVKFSTYATWWVRNALQSCVQNKMRLVRLPSKICESLFRLNVVLHKLGEDASSKEIAARTSLSIKQVRTLRELRSTRAGPPISLDQTGGGAQGDRPPLVEKLCAEMPDMDHEISVREEAEGLDVLLADLPDRSRHILSERFGLANDHAKTLASIGRQLGLTRERVRQIEKIALGDLRMRAARTQWPNSQL